MCALLGHVIFFQNSIDLGDFLWCPKDSADKNNGRFIIEKKFPLSGIF